MNEVRKQQPVNATSVYLIVCEFSAVGGVTFKRKSLPGSSGGETRHYVTQRADDEELLQESRSIVNAAYYTTEKYAAKTPLGYFVDTATLKILEREIREGAQEGADIFNREARRRGSERRVIIGIYPVLIESIDPRVGQRLAQVVHDCIYDIYLALRTGSAKETQRSAFRQAPNLEKIVGTKREIFRSALAHARGQRRDLAARLKRGEDPIDAGKKLDLAPLEKALDAFKNTVDLEKC